MDTQKLLAELKLDITAEDCLSIMRNERHAEQNRYNSLIKEPEQATVGELTRSIRLLIAYDAVIKCFEHSGKNFRD